MQELYKQLKECGHVRPGALMAKYTTFHIGGPVQFLVEVKETEKLVTLLNYLMGEGIPYFILGGGSNLLWQDDEWEGVVIKLESQIVKLESQVIVAEAGASFAAMVMLAVQNNLAGLEWAAGMPGTVGGAVRGNAGAMDSDTSRSLEKIEVWRDGEVITLKPEACEYGYRDSAFKRNTDVVLRAWFKTTPGDKIALMQTMQATIKGRNGKYPASPSAGSFFKNCDVSSWSGDRTKLPEKFLTTGKIPAGWINEQNGLKGFAVGGAKVSDEHGNFLINYNKATQADVLQVVEEVQKRVYDTFKAQLEVEVVIKQ
jgi:UDP-N-acetylmuramate dehydrogenase